jgi:DNA segregation ATPase FtsK/SpoIIIE, S-DNA-T family
VPRLEQPSVTTVALAIHGRSEPVRVRLTESARMADLAEVLGLDHLTIDGTAVAPTTALRAAGLRAGCVVGAPTAAIAPATPDDAVVSGLRLRWVAGPDAGHDAVLAPGLTTLGRALGAGVRADDPALAPFAALLDVSVDGVAVLALAPNGAVASRLTAEDVAHDGAPGPAASRLTAGDLLHLGDGVAVVAPTEPPSPRPIPVEGPPWHTVLSRPPRPGRAAPAEPVGAPPAPPAAAAPPPLPLTTLAAGATTGLVVGALTGRPILAFVGLAGSLAGLAVSLGQRWSGRRRHRWARRQWQVDLAAHDAAAAGWIIIEQRRRRLDGPGLVHALERCQSGSARLWERRRDHHDAYRAVLGMGAQPSLGGPLLDVPVDVRLGPGDTVGIVGPPATGRAIARALVVQLCTWHGPADLALDVEGGGWHWTAWLPHLATPTLVAGPPTLHVRDGDDAAASARRDPAGAMLVVATRAEALPAWCTTVVELATGSAVVRPTGAVASTVRPAGLSEARAEAAARRLAGFVDPELEAADLLPDTVSLLGLLGPTATPESLVERWADGAGRPRCPLGRSAGGVVTIDLDCDGPHLLVAGTTGAGKSELLRTLVLGLAASCSPDDMTFLLVDFKGGSAVDALADLPHVVGLVTDLDGDLAGRMVRSLEAELRWREQVLREAGAQDLATYRGRGRRPLPRLVVVVDELATLVAERPDFVPALVALAQRGRSLGLHLVLATQRPAGAVTDDVRANTGLRICLRVTDRHDAIDVVGDPAPAHLPPERPGRAVLRRAGRAIETLQVASLAQAGGRPGRPVELVAPGTASEHGSTSPGGDQLVNVLRQAAAGLAPPRRPWLPELPAHVGLADLPAGAAALADDPDAQARPPVGWDPSQGHLLVCGATGSGTSSTLLTVAVAAATGTTPDALHLYAVDADGSLGVLARLSHTGEVLAASDRGAQARLLRRLRGDIERGRSLGAPAVVVVIDGLDSLRAAFDDVAGQTVLDDLARVLADGPGAGIHVAASARRPGSLPASTVAAFGTRWLHRLGDPDEARSFGVPPSAVAGAGPGRIAVAGWARVEAGPGPGWCSAQVGVVDEAVIASISRASSVARAPAVGRLPVSVGPPPRASRRGGATSIPVGVGDAELGPAVLTLHDGDGLLVAGPPGSGRTTALGLIAHQLRAARPECRLVVVTGPGDGPSRLADVVVRRDDLAALASLAGPAVVVVDDAERVDDGPGHLAALAARHDVHLLVAGRADALRGHHWTQAVRRQRIGLLLCPGADDGDLLGVILPRRRWTAWVPGRAELVQGGRAELVQLGVPPPTRRRRAA